jgi:hypothetical protein
VEGFIGRRRNQYAGTPQTWQSESDSFKGCRGGANSGTILRVASSKKILDAMRREPRNVRFVDLFKVRVEHFGEARQKGSSHAVFKTPWPGDPRVNIQNDRGTAKAYQVRQVLLAIDKLGGMSDKGSATKGSGNEAQIEKKSPE